MEYGLLCGLARGGVYASHQKEKGKEVFHRSIVQSLKFNVQSLKKGVGEAKGTNFEL
jgi:hypothetical protein